MNTDDIEPDALDATNAGRCPKGVTKGDILMLALLSFAFGVACIGLLATGGGRILLGIGSGLMFVGKLGEVLLKHRHDAAGRRKSQGKLKGRV